jgi:CRP/FNR family cyclic AMP-dependent transcriptional regulator
VRPLRAYPHDGADGAGIRDGRVALLQVDPGLRAAIPTDEQAVADRVAVAPCRAVAPGPWSPQSLGADAAFGALLIRGLVTHETTIAHRRSAELFGPGDLLRPWPAFDSAVPATSRWASDAGAVMALLDRRFLAAARRWPELFVVLHDRIAEQLDRAIARAAIMALPRVEQRVLGLFWQLAERWGTVRPEGIGIDLALTHELIGQLIGARRPTVSLALRPLAHDGLLQRTATGGWLLAHDSLDALPRVGPSGPVRAAAGDPPGRSVSRLARR